MLTVEKKKKYTAEDYMMLEEGAPFQLVENNLVMSPSPSLIHQLILGEFYDAIKAFVKQQKNPGLVILPPMDIYFDEDNVYQPDLIYISQDRITQIVKDRIEGAPDMVIEILSPSNAYYDLRQKKDIYQKYGVKECNTALKEFGLRRMFLHAHSLSFVNSKGEPFSVSAPLDAELQGVLDKLNAATPSRQRKTRAT